MASKPGFQPIKWSLYLSVAVTVSSLPINLPACLPAARPAAGTCHSLTHACPYRPVRMPLHAQLVLQDVLVLAVNWRGHTDAGQSRADPLTTHCTQHLSFFLAFPTGFACRAGPDG